MEIKLIHGMSDEELATLYIVVNGKEEINAYPGEPEDFSLERDLNFVYRIAPLMRMAHEAGMAGEKFTVTEEQAEDE